MMPGWHDVTKFSVRLKHQVFHAKAYQWRQINALTIFLDANGIRREPVIDMEEVVVTFFRDLFSTSFSEGYMSVEISLDDKRVTNNMNQD